MKIYNNILVLLLLLVSTSASAYDFVLNNIYYNLNISAATATVTHNGSTNCYSGNVEIPETFINTKNVEFTVIGIDDSAFKNCTNLSSVSLPNTIETIANNAFYGCTKISTLTLPRFLESIGEYAFNGCTKLTSITVPNNVTSIGRYAFNGCTLLQTVSLPSAITDIKDYTFQNCSSLTNIVIPDKVNSIGNYAFYGCSKLATVQLPLSVKTLGEYSFYGCSSLSSLSLSSSVSSIGNYAFQNCSSLSSLTLSEGLNSIGVQAFYGCSSLQALKLPSTLNSIGSNAFASSAVKTLEYAEGTQTALRTYADQIVFLTLPSTLKTIPERAFYGCTSLASLYLPEGLTTIGNYAFYNTSSLPKVTLPASLTSVGTDAFASSGITTLEYAEGTVTAHLTYAKKIVNLVLPSTLVTIPDNAFVDCTRLAKLTLPANVQSIGSSAFANCTALTQVSLSEHINSIGAAAFQNCSSLATLIFPTYMTLSGINWDKFFAQDTFSGCTKLENIHIPEPATWNYIFAHQRSNPFTGSHRLYYGGLPLTTLNADFGCDISNYAFQNCKELKKVNVTSSVTGIQDYAFQNCPDLETVEMGSGVGFIGSDCFQGCTSLTAVRIGSGVKTIGKNAFYGCINLNTVLMGGSETTIGPSAFEGCSAMKNLRLPSTVKSIGQRAFYDCKMLGSITIPAGVSQISSYTFTNCLELTSVGMSDAVKTLGSYAFQNCKRLKAINIPDATTSIGDYCFDKCDSLKSVYVGSGLRSLGTNSFANCKLLLGFYCYAQTPPTCSSNTFTGSDPQYASLYVPEESLAKYNSASVWSTFGEKVGLSSAPIYVSSVSITPDVLIIGDDSTGEKLTANILPADATNKNLKWSSANTAVAYVSSKGVVMPEAEGMTTITATATDNNGGIGKCVVIVNNRFKPVTDVTLSAEELTLREGQEEYLYGTTAPATATYGEMKWSSSNPDVATVNGLGLVTALTEGTARITCAAADGRGAKAECDVTVTKPVDPTIGDATDDGEVTISDLVYVIEMINREIHSGADISLYDLDGDGQITREDVLGIADIILGRNESRTFVLDLPVSELSIDIDETRRIDRIVIPYRNESSLYWSSSNEDVATVDEHGIVTGISIGSATITVTSDDEESPLSATCLVKVERQVTGTTDGYKWVDLGLPSGTRWATCNIGAETPEGYGDYFAWGETTTKSQFSWSNYTLANGSATTLTKYCTATNKGSRDDLMQLDASDDAASQLLSTNWALPTQQQYEELFNSTYTTSEWKTINGINGRLVTSKRNGCTVFLPAGGYYNGSSTTSRTTGGYYATRDLSSSDCAYNQSVNVGSSSVNTNNTTYRCYGQSMRPVIGKYIVMQAGTVYVDKDQTCNLSASAVSPDGTVDTAVSWTSEDETIATVSADGTVKGIANGIVRIFATTADGIVGYCTVIVGRQLEFTVDGVTFSMILVEHGTFTMGATPEQQSPDRNESPTHVTISQDYYIGETEVTQALWKAVTGYSPSSGDSQWSSSRGLGDNYPAYSISYTDVQDFITKLNAKTGKTFRMPTEAEWEYAARGGNKSKGYQYSGSNTIGDVAWYSGNSSSKTHQVKTKAANELGIYDMSGNVYEWCSDWYDSYSSSSVTDPTGPTSGPTRVARGGSWVCDAWNCRVANRDASSPSNRYTNYGVRIALSSSQNSQNTPSGGSNTNGHEYVDLGLSVKWATCNVGANSPTDYGDYYAWGETETKPTYNWSTYKWCNGSSSTMTKYCTSSSYGKVDNKTVLDPEDDAAHVKWGGNWRMPTYAEFTELTNTNNCSWTWKTNYNGSGINGYEVRSKKSGYTDKFIFLPAAGDRSGGSLYDVGSWGHYWSSSLYSGNSGYACGLNFGSGGVTRRDYSRYYGLSVRPVCP